MGALFTDPPVRLKHLDQAPLIFTVTGGAVPSHRLPGGGILVPGAASDGRPRSA